MSAPDYIPFESSDEDRYSTGSKRKSSPSDSSSDYESDASSRSSKRVRLGNRPTRISNVAGSSPLSAVVPENHPSENHPSENVSSENISSENISSENVPTQSGFNAPQATQHEAEAEAQEFGPEYHAWALEELKTAVGRYENINADGFIDEDALRFLIEKIRANVLSKHDLVVFFSSVQASSGSCNTSTGASGTPPSDLYAAAASEAAPSNENTSFSLSSSSNAGNPQLPSEGSRSGQADAEVIIIDGMDDERPATPPSSSKPSTKSTDNNTTTTTTPTSSRSYAEASTQTPSRPSAQAEISTQAVSPVTTVTADVSTQATEAYQSTQAAQSTYTTHATQSTDPTTPPSPSSHLDLWKQSLEHIRQPNPFASDYHCPITTVECQLREFITVSDKDHAEEGSGSSNDNTHAAHKQKRVVEVIDLLSSDDEDEDVAANNAGKAGPSNRNSNGHNISSAFRVGGASDHGHGHGHDDDDEDENRKRHREQMDEIFNLFNPGQQLYNQETAAAAAATPYSFSSNTAPFSPLPYFSHSAHMDMDMGLDMGFDMGLDMGLNMGLDSEDEDEKTNRHIESFYGLEKRAARSQASRWALRYQDNVDGLARKPGPKAGHQLDLDKYFAHMTASGLSSSSNSSSNSTSSSASSSLSSSTLQPHEEFERGIEETLKETSWGFKPLESQREKAAHMRTSSSSGTSGSRAAGAYADGDDEDDVQVVGAGAAGRAEPASEIEERRRWRGGPGGYCMVKGFPLVEDVRFVAAANEGSPSGDCYWRALSFHLYGATDRHWDLVKAEHLAFVYHVLTHPSHPRFKLYSEELNGRFFDTASSVLQGGPYERQGFKANLWQVLHLQHAWTPALMQQVTADLYNVCVIMFSASTKGKGGSGGGAGTIRVKETTMRGSYNSRHIFLLYLDGCHFQPMVPADYMPSEFQYPRPAVADTAIYRFAPRATYKGGKKSSVEHGWRHEFTSSAPLPVPRLHGCDTATLRRYMGSGDRC